MDFLNEEKAQLQRTINELFQKIIHLTCATNGYCDASLQLMHSECLSKKEKDILEYIISFKRSNGTYPRYGDVVFRFKTKEDIDLELPITYGFEKEHSKNKNKENQENNDTDKDNKGKTKNDNSTQTKSQYQKDYENFKGFVDEFLWTKNKLFLIDKIENFIPQLIKGTLSENCIRDFIQFLYETYPYAIPDTVESLEKRLSNESFGISSKVEAIDNITGGFKRKQLITISGDEKSYTFYSTHLLKDVVLNKLNVCYISFNTLSDVVLCRLLTSLSENLIGKRLNLYNTLLGSQYKSDTFDKLLKEFKSTYQYNINFIDNDNFESFDIDWLNKLLYSTTQKFVSNTLRPIDVIFVEGLENAKLEKNYHITSSSASISNTYINYLKHYAKKHNVAVIILTSQNGKNFKNIAFKNGFTDLTEAIPHIDVMSDIFILCKYTKPDEKYHTKGELMLQLVKSPLGYGQEEPIRLDIDAVKSTLVENEN